jgi:hypothetical protein
MDLVADYASSDDERRDPGAQPDPPARVRGFPHEVGAFVVHVYVPVTLTAAQVAAAVDAVAAVSRRRELSGGRRRSSLRPPPSLILPGRSLRP